LTYLNLGGPGGKPLLVAAVAKLILNLENLLSVGGYASTGKAVVEAGKMGGEMWTSKMR
jgi:hypothetical protein